MLLLFILLIAAYSILHLFVDDDAASANPSCGGPMASTDDLGTSNDDCNQNSGAEKRVIFINRPQPNKFCNNHISTAKYR